MKLVSHQLVTRRLLIPVLFTVVSASAFIATSRTHVSAYSFSTSGMYLSEHDYANSAYSLHSIDYGSWSCGGGLCAVPINSMLQYVDVYTMQSSFSCWYQEVFTYPANWRAGYRTTHYNTTPWYNYQYSWGYATSASGDQIQGVSIGDDSGECSYYGWGGGLHFMSSIVRNSTSAYLYSYGW